MKYSATAWAVFLGCNTVARLAREWGVSLSASRGYLSRAMRDGKITRISRGTFKALFL